MVDLDFGRVGLGDAVVAGVPVAGDHLAAGRVDLGGRERVALQHFVACVAAVAVSVGRVAEPVAVVAGPGARWSTGMRARTSRAATDPGMVVSVTVGGVVAGGVVGGVVAGVVGGAVAGVVVAAGVGGGGVVLGAAATMVGRRRTAVWWLASTPWGR